MLERARIGLAFVGLLFLAFILIVTGIQGSFGRLLAVVLAPGRLDVQDSQGNSTTSSTSASTSSSAGGTAVTL